MAFSNVSLLDSYDLWRTRHNQLVSWVNALDASNVINFVSNSAALIVPGSSTKLGTIYLTVNPATSVNDTSSANVASAALANTIYQFARAGADNANTGASNAYAMANSVNVTAGAAYAQANSVVSNVVTALTTAQGAFAKANTLASLTTNGIVEIATTSEFRTGTDQLRVLSVSETWNSAAEVRLTDNTTIVIDGSTFINANVTLGNNRTLGTWSNPKVQAGYIRVIQDATGNRTLGYHGDYEFSRGTAFTLSTLANTEDMIYYQVIAPGRVLLTLISAIA